MTIEYRGFLISPYKLVPTAYYVATAGQGGKIPKVLETLFTSTGVAKDSIDNYLLYKLEKVINKSEKEVKNGKTSSES